MTPYEIEQKEAGDLRHAVEDKIEWCLTIYRTAGHEIRTPDIRYDLRGRCAGQSCRDYCHPYLRFNWPLLNKYKEKFIEQTVVHEIAHLIADFISDHRCKPHGRTWKSVMRNLGILHPKRCHSYDTSDCGARKRKRYIYKCDCRDELKIGPVRHKKQQSGRSNYSCNICRARIVYTGKMKYV